MSILLLRTTVAVCLLLAVMERSQAFFLSTRKQHGYPGTKLRSSFPLESYYDGQAPNHTAMDVLDSLNFLANYQCRDLRAEKTFPMVAMTTTTAQQENSTDILEPPPLHHQVSNVTDAASNEGTPDESSDAQDMQSKNPSEDTDGDEKPSVETTSSDIPKVSIGGQEGTVYNVNRLKKNLVQEMVKNCKQELWDDLGKPSADFSVVEDKLAALVQSNAVTCTTDSNLLDGQWTFAFGSRQSASVLMDPNRFDIAARRTKEVPSPRKVKGKSRCFYLEEMPEEDDAHVLDRTSYLGGVVGSVQRYNVTRLTRTSLNLTPCRQEWSLFGRRIRRKEPPPQSSSTMDLRVLYVDNDMCVCTSGDLAVSPFYVYTKSAAWVGRSQRMKRDARLVLSTMRRLRDSVLAVVFLRKRLWSAIHKKKKQVPDDASAAKILVRLDEESKKLTVLKLGDLENEANAWDGEDDPFVHLSADERQEKLKKMRVRDIEKAARRQRNRNAKKERRAEKRKSFKKPDE